MTQSKLHQPIWSFGNCAVIVAHPDDETLWAGGTILLHPETQWTVLALCRKSDRDRAPKFFQTLKSLQASGEIADLDDGPEQLPLPELEVQNTILALLPSRKFDLVITHSRWGEYTRHLRHQETAKAVWDLWQSGRITTNQIWTFAYEDSDGRYLPRAIKDADRITHLSKSIWQRKYDIITRIYGFWQNSFEAKTTPREEAFWCFNSAQEIEKRLKNRG